MQRSLPTLRRRLAFAPQATVGSRPIVDVDQPGRARGMAKSMPTLAAILSPPHATIINAVEATVINAMRFAVMA